MAWQLRLRTIATGHPPRLLAGASWSASSTPGAGSRTPTARSASTAVLTARAGFSCFFRLSRGF
eukprot:2863489-Alexandrium_andersonii.AAC.1